MSAAKRKNHEIRLSHTQDLDYQICFSTTGTFTIKPYDKDFSPDHTATCNGMDNTEMLQIFKTIVELSSDLETDSSAQIEHPSCPYIISISHTGEISLGLAQAYQNQVSQLMAQLNLGQSS